ncbi:hypothetical protein, partial [Methanobrevibacter sp.]
MGFFVFEFGSLFWYKLYEFVPLFWYKLFFKKIFCVSKKMVHYKKKEVIYMSDTKYVGCDTWKNLRTGEERR